MTRAATWIRRAMAALLISWLGAPAPLHALNGETWRIYKPTNTGVPGNYTYSIYIDEQDVVWLTADDPVWDEGGLARFDGDTWRTWTNVDGLSPTHFVHGLRTGPDGHLWLGSDLGLLRFDGVRLNVVWNASNAPWPTNGVSDFAWDSVGNLWVALDDRQTVRGGLAMYDGIDWTVYTTANGLPWRAPWDNVTAVEVDDLDNVWIGSDVMGGAIYDGSRWTWLGVEGSHVNDIEIAADGEPWYAFNGIGVRSWNGQRWVDRNGPFGTNDVSLVTLDREGFMWIATYIGTIWRFDGRSWSTAYSVPAFSHIYALAFDSLNRPRVGGIGGLSTLESGRWTRYSGYTTGLPSRWLKDIFIDSTGTAWIGNSGGGLATFDGVRWVNFNPYNDGTPPWPFPTDSAFETLEDFHGRIFATAMYNGVGEWDDSLWTAHLPNRDIRSLALDSLGRLWAAPYGGVAMRWDGMQWESMDNPQATRIYDVAIDQYDNVWLATVVGLMKFDGIGWTTWTSDYSGLPDDFVTAVAPEPAGTAVWVGTASGLARFDGSSWTVYTEADSGIPADVISCLAFAPDGALWVGAFDGQTWPYHGGVARFDGSSWTTFTSSNSPLPHEQVEALTVDVAGNVWIGTASEGMAIILAAPPAAIPEPPEALIAEALSSSAVALSWTDRSSDEEGFSLERCAGSNEACDADPNAYRVIASLGPDSTTFSDQGVVAGAIYTYRIRAFNAAGLSAWSNTAEVTMPLSSPAAPSDLRATARTSRGKNKSIWVDLSWIDNADNEEAFVVERCIGKGCTSFSPILSVGANAQSYRDEEVASRTTYSYRVKATNGGGSSTWSNVATVTTK